MNKKISKEEKDRISTLFFMKHIDDFMLMFPYHIETVKLSEIHAFVKSLEKNEQMKEYLELIKDVKEAYQEMHTS